MSAHLAKSVLAIAAVLTCAALHAQVNVLTSHNDNARDGQNLSETVLTPSNVNPTQFGKLFAHTVSGPVFAQPLYAYQISIPGKGIHNVVYVETDHDMVYAFDADTNGAGNGTALWQVSLLTNTTPAGTLTVLSGVWGTPVIDLESQTMYLVSSETMGGAAIFRLHALDITTGAEKFGGPLQIRASIAGTGSDSSAGVLSFDPTYQKQRAGLLMQNGIVYVGFGSNNDEGPWHGWLFSFNVNPSTQLLQQINVFCTTPNTTGGGIWMGGSGLAGEVYSPSKPYGRLFFSTGNGTFSASKLSYGMSLVDLDLTGGVMTLEDSFTPFNQATLSANDADLGSGGPLLLPSQTLASGKTLNPLVEIGKLGMFYILDRDNVTDGSNNPATEYSPAGLGGYNTAADKVVQEVETPLTPGYDWGAGVWGTTAYWNNNLYSGGTNVADTNNTGGTGTSLTAWSFVNGILSTSPTSESNELYVYPSATPVVSANGNTNGVLWALSAVPQSSGKTLLVLLAYDATNLGKTLYSSSTNLARDNPGGATKYNVPTIANGKVYVGADGEISIYGLLNLPTTPPPVITPGSQSFTTPQTITITDANSSATIYYTTDGSVPTSASAVYQSSTPLILSTSATVTAIASASGYIASAPVSAVYTSLVVPPAPVFSLSAGNYIGAQPLTITDATSTAAIYYTLNGSTPTTASTPYTGPIAITATETVTAIAVNPGPNTSSPATAAYTIEPVGTIDFTNGFAVAQGPMQFNGSTTLDDFRLQLTNGDENEAGSAFYATPVNIQAFTTKFTLQLSNPVADGSTFTIQNVAPTALGGHGGGLGYVNILKSIAIKFDLYSNNGEGFNSTGLYIDGATPTVPSIDLTNTGINLHSGDYIDVTLTYDGSILTLTLSDEITLATWSRSFVIDIPGIVGSNTAYVGFTAGTGGSSASQKISSWIYMPASLPAFPGFAAGALTLNGGATTNGTRLRLTDGNQSEARSAFLTTPVNVQQFTSSFEFQLTAAAADGFTFTIQGVGPNALGGHGGSLGYQHILNSVAIKFDLCNNNGEGNDSTGMYTNGAIPTVPSVNLTGTGIKLHSGDPFLVNLTYDGATLTVIITDTVTGATASQAYTVNIPQLVGGNTAYAGFTAGSGSTTAVQEILNWNFTPTTN